jgi:hypothetical protein
MNADQIKQQYSGYQSWNDPAAIMADFKATGGAGKGGPTNTQPSSSNFGATSTSNPLVDQAQQLRNFTVQANQPAVQSLEASKQPLEQRYNSLLQSMTAHGSTNINNQTVASNAELARRGVVGGLADTTTAQNLSPVIQANQGAIGGLQSAYGQDTASINNAIAALQTGNPEGAITNALGLYSAQQQGSLAQANLSMGSLFQLAQLALGSANLGIAGGNLAVNQANLAKGITPVATGFNASYGGQPINTQSFWK